MLSSPSNSSYPPPPQKYARLSISAPKQKGQENDITAPLSTFRSLGAIQKKQKRRSSETHMNKVSSKLKCIECLDAFLLSRCCRKKKEAKEPEFEVFQQPDPGQDYTFPEFAAYMVRTKKKYLLSQMEGTIPYNIERHCWREWGFSRINRILSHGSDSDFDRKTGYKPPRISESEVSRIYRSGLYMKEGWEQWAKMRYPNGIHTYGPPLP